MMKYSLWLRPGMHSLSKLQKIIDHLSIEYDAPIFSPHITLLGGIVCAESVAIETSHSMAKGTQAFEITIQGIEMQQKFYQCLYLHTQLNEPLSRLREMAVKAFGEPGNQEYLPHISLLYGNYSIDEKRAMLSGPIVRNVPGTVYITHIDIYETTGMPEQWRCIESISLQT